MRKVWVFGILALVGVLSFISGGVLIIVHNTQYFISGSLLIGGASLFGVIFLKVLSVRKE